jgi:hypothetical protein
MNPERQYPVFSDLRYLSKAEPEVSQNPEQASLPIVSTFRYHIGLWLLSGAVPWQTAHVFQPRASTLNI